MKRILAIPIVLLSALVGWLVAAIDYVYFGQTSPIIALMTMYVIVAWELRAWRSLHYRIPCAIVIGAFILSALKPIEVRSVRVIRPNADLMTAYGDFGYVNFSVTGAIILLITILLVSPWESSNSNLQNESETSAG